MTDEGRLLRLETCLNEVANVLAAHLAGHQGGMTPNRIKELVQRLDEAQAALQPPGDVEIEGQTGVLIED